MKTAMLETIMRFLAFGGSLRTIFITAALAVGILLATQSKLPMRLHGSPDTAGRENPSTELRVNLRLPIASYSGPAILQIEHGAFPHGGSMTIETGNRVRASGFITPGRAGEKKFLLYPGSFARGGSLVVVLRSTEAMPEASGTIKARVDFPKAGRWLIPDFPLWTGLVLIGFLLGATADIFWSSRPVAHLSYAVVSLLTVMAIFLLGLEFAARLGGLLPAVVLLFAATSSGRIFILSRGRDQ